VSEEIVATYAFLVSFSVTIDLFAFVELENYLSDVLGIKVDLVMKEGIKPLTLKREF
jgi:predicted nucleotidyltransferase